MNETATSDSNPERTMQSFARHAQPSRPSRITRLWRSYRRPLMGAGTLLVLAAGWELSTALGLVNPMFVSSPARVIEAGVSYVGSPTFRSDFLASAQVFLVGFILAVVAGIAIGFSMGWSRRVEYLLDYVVSIAHASPRIALVPLLILWFGIGARSQIATVFLMGLFPMIINSMAGVKTVDRIYLELARSYNASSLQVLRTIVFPASVPYVLSGVRLAIATGLIGVVVAEFTASTAGIGHRMQRASSLYNTDLVFVGLFIISLCGLTLTQMAKRAEKHFERWRI